MIHAIRKMKIMMPAIYKMFPLAFIFLIQCTPGSSSIHTRDDPGACSCDCCEVGRRREEEQAEEAAKMGGIEKDDFECVFAPAATAGFIDAPKCGNLCRQDASDSVLTSTEESEIDTQRFCFFECKPSRSTHAGPKPGDMCKAFSKDEKSEVKDH